MKLPFALVLCASVIFLNGGSGGADSNPSPTSQEIRSDKHKDAPKDVKDKAEKQAKPTSPTAFEKSLIETLRTVADRQKAAYEQNDANQKAWNSPSMLVNIALVVAAFAYTIFAGLQWCAIKEQANIARQQANIIVQQQRPWLIVTPTEPENWPSTANVNLITFPVRIIFGSSVKNTGNSPAFLTQQHINVVAAAIPIPDDPPQYSDPPRFAEMAIPPNGTHAQKRWKEFNSAEFQSIMAGQQCVMFYGFVKYFDSLREVEHQTRFCAYWHKRPQDIGTIRWSFMLVGPSSYIEYT